MPEFVGRTPFVGRDQELRRLRAALGDAAKGEPQIVLISGEPGIGKTRLLSEFAQRALAEGWPVLSGRAYDTEGMPSYLPFIEALGDQIRAMPLDELRALLDDAGPEVALLAPELRRRLPDLVAIQPAEPEERRYRLFESVCDFLFAIPRFSEAPGLLLVLDDLQWADRPSLHLLQHLIRRVRGRPLLIAAAYRPVDLDRTHPLVELLAESRRESLAERLVLAPFTSVELAAFIERLTGDRPDVEVVDTIARQTDGNPFFAGEVVRDLLAAGRDLSAPAVAAAARAVPEGVREVIDRRLARLSAAANESLQVAAVLGDGFSFQELRAACAGDDPDLLNPLEEILATGMLREAGQAYEFGHALIRQAVYDGLRQPRRQRLHLQVAQGLEGLHAANLGPYVAAIAAHYVLAGPEADEKAIQYALRAGEAAEAVFANEDAAAHWESALAIMDERGMNPQQRIRLLERLTDLLFDLGTQNLPKAIAYGEQALRLCAEIGQAERAAEMHCRIARALTGMAKSQDLPAALAHLRAAQSILETGPERPSQIRFYHGLGLVAFWSARTQEGLAATRRAMELEERLGDHTFWVHSRFTHGLHRVSAGSPREGLELIERAWSVANELKEWFPAWLGSNWVGQLSLLLDDPQSARAWLEREAARPRQAETHQSTLRLQGLRAMIACAYARGGDLASAERLGSELGDTESSQPVAQFWQALIALYLGRWEQAETLWLRARQRYQLAGNRFSQAQSDCWVARVRQVSGNASGAETLLEDALTISVDGPIVPIEVIARAELALLAVQASRSPDAELHLERLRSIVAEGEDWRGLAGRIALAAAAVLGADGQMRSAEQQFELALATFRQYGLPWDEAEALHWWGRSLLAAGQPAAALAKLDAAIDIYRSHGAGEAWVEHVLADRRQAEASTPDPPQAEHPTPSVPAYPDGLSLREVEVLRLIAAGRINREIGEQLFISLNTVDRHVSHIFAKTGVANRAEAASYAHRHGLAE